MVTRCSILRIPSLLISFAAATLLLGSGCAGPPVLERQVLAYDEVAKTLDEKLLLLNVARVASGDTIQFTSTSSIAATFDWTTTIGATSRLKSGSQANFVDLNLGASASENPTFSIVPVSGDAFTRRVVTRFRDEAFEFLVYQGGRINQVMRLMASGIEVQTPVGIALRSSFSTSCSRQRSAILRASAFPSPSPDRKCA
jgi:hypothetical protein